MNIFHVFFKANSGKVARDRLKDVVLSDRLGCSTETTERIKKDITDVLSRYMELDPEGLQLQFDTGKTKQGGIYVKTIQIKGL